MVKSRANSKGQAPRELNGVEKATALLLSMGKPKADLILKQLDNNHIRTLTRSALELPDVHLDRIDALLQELAAEVEKGSPLAGSPQGAKSLLSGVVAEETINEMMDEIAGEPPKAIWSRLVGVPVARLTAFISCEQPQVAAYVLSNLPPSTATEVIEKLDLELQADISARLLALKPISKEAARMVADRLEQDLLGPESEATAASGHSKLGAILNNLQRDQINGILDRIAAHSRDDADKVRKFIFSFEDMAGLSPEALSRVLDEVPTERTVLALTDCDPALTEHLLSALSPRSRRMVEAELSAGTSPPIKAVIDARRSIAALVLSLAEKSAIQLPTTSTDERSP